MTNQNIGANINEKNLDFDTKNCVKIDKEIYCPVKTRPAVQIRHKSKKLYKRH